MASNQYKRLIELSLTAPAEGHVIRAVMTRIERVILQRMRQRALVYGIFMVGALAVFKPALDLLVNGMSRSGFLEYLSLLTSDGISFFVNWRELTFSLVESVPTLEISIVIAVVLLFAYSTRLTVSVFTNPMIYKLK